MTAEDSKVAAGRMPYELLSREEVERLAGDVPGWKLGEKEISREFRFKDFREAMGFVNTVAGLAEAADHHPDIFISYNRVTLTLSTHKVGGLSRRDFLLATGIDAALRNVSERRGGGE